MEYISDPMDQTLHQFRTAYFVMNATYVRNHGSLPTITAATWRKPAIPAVMLYEQLCREEITNMVSELFI